MKTKPGRKALTVLIAAALALAVMLPSPRGLAAGSSSVTVLHADYAANIYNNDYSTFSHPVNSYVYEDSSGTVVCQYIPGTGFVARGFDAEGTQVRQFVAEEELSYFGGFYCGKNYNFIVWGQANKRERSDIEVLRVVKYDKGWVRLAACSVRGANSSDVFTAGSCAMTEAEDELTIHTCHYMYAIDGVNHQANMTFVVSIPTMTYKRGFYDVGSVSQNGYVSHSFNQLISTDGTYIFRADHGDAMPRAVTLVRSVAGQSVTAIDFALVFPIGGKYSADPTGVSIGGLALSKDNCLIAGASVAQNALTYNCNGQKNVFVTVTDKGLKSTSVKYLTNHAEGSAVYVSTPQIAALDTDAFAVFWDETPPGGGTRTCVQVIDGNGAALSPIHYDTDIRLSDCRPVLTSDGLLTWFASWSIGDSVQTTLFKLALSYSGASSGAGDVDFDGYVTAGDARFVLRCAIGLELFDETHVIKGDLDGDGELTAQDARLVLRKALGL
ncbi:MAG: dockerin type I repeat-containing protein [Clostridia bacterium]|nr:dockerin type I repeat-containing protein [Clostridia bacterium]